MSMIPKEVVGDIALQWGDGLADLAKADDDIVADEGIRTALLLSLFTDRRAEADDQLPGDDDLRGWWGDEFSEIQGDQIGSRLWLLERAKRLPGLIPRAEEIIREAVAWMIEDRVASRIDVTIETDQLALVLQVVVHRPDKEPATFHFAHVWEAP